MKKLGIPMVLVVAMLLLLAPQAASASHWGVAVGVGPAYVSPYYGYPYYAAPYYPYYYGYPPYSPYYYMYPRDEWGHAWHEWHEHNHGHHWH